MSSLYRIHSLSYGPVKAGGYWHEHFWAKQISKQKEAEKYTVQWAEFRKKTYAIGLGQKVQLLVDSFRLADADDNLVVPLMALGAIIRNWWSRKRVRIIWHSHDEQYIHGWALIWYFRCVWFLLRRAQGRSIEIITDSQYWQHYFEEKTRASIPVRVWPNCFNVLQYASFKNSQKRKQIHFGQWHTKNDPRILELANELHAAGYRCYFSTLFPNEAGNFGYYEICYFEEFEAYLRAMSESAYTLALSTQREGWNRMAHESILVGTDVIGYASGGLGDLLHESNSIVVGNIEKAKEAILQQRRSGDTQAFIQNYSIETAHSRILD